YRIPHHFYPRAIRQLPLKAKDLIPLAAGRVEQAASVVQLPNEPLPFQPGTDQLIRSLRDPSPELGELFLENFSAQAIRCQGAFQFSHLPSQLEVGRI